LNFKFSSSKIQPQMAQRGDKEKENGNTPSGVNLSSETNLQDQAFQIWRKGLGLDRPIFYGIGRDTFHEFAARLLSFSQK
jgi:hypothetical protein